jgi:hypothetical protein
MTAENHRIIVKAALKALKMMPAKERRKLIDKREEKYFKWVNKYPCWRSPEEEKAMDIILRATKKL